MWLFVNNLHLQQNIARFKRLPQFETFMQPHSRVTESIEYDNKVVVPIDNMRC